MLDKTKFLADDGDIRSYMRNPFLSDDKVIYTNGYIMLIEPYREGIVLPPKPLNFNKIIDAIAAAEFKKPRWPALPEKQPCKACDGTGKNMHVECPECEGDRYVFFSNQYNSYEFTCETCGGYGRVKQSQPDQSNCNKCNGAGRTWPIESHIEIDGININPAYAELIIHEPDLEISVNSEITALLFRAGDSCGAIMGMRI